MILTLKQFMKKYNLKDQTMSESDLQKVYNYKIYPRDSKITSDRGFVILIMEIKMERIGFVL